MISYLSLLTLLVLNIQINYDSRLPKLKWKMKIKHTYNFLRMFIYIIFIYIDTLCDYY